jgi:DNA-directed RNA polymerase sigma subunit (sigma70/sigma32)
MVEVSLDQLSSRERRVYETRLLADNKPLSLEALEALATEFGLARARVRQLEARVVEKIGADISVDQKE